jgi:hypothetical protein
LVLPLAAEAQSKKKESAAQPSPSAETASLDAELVKSRGDVVKAMTVYRRSLEKLRTIYEQEFQKRATEVVDRRLYYEKGIISRLELEEGERRLADVEAKLKEVEQKIVETKFGVTEAVARQDVTRLPPLAVGGYVETPGLIRYNGGAAWSLADAKKIEKFFKDTFGRSLPVSAMGQTPLHDRMKLDHRNAIDVALHPDSSEGRALMIYLRKSGIPFTAFRNRVAGSASGAHVHIGRPSLRNGSSP